MPRNSFKLLPSKDRAKLGLRLHGRALVWHVHMLGGGGRESGHVVQLAECSPGQYKALGSKSSIT